MILKGKIHNFAGIQTFDIDFTQKHIYEKEQAEQVGHEGSDYFALVPTFLAKNASGKTSIVKALDFILSFVTTKNFYKQIQSYFADLIWLSESRLERGHRKNVLNKRNVNTKLMDFNLINLLSSELDVLIQKTFMNLSYAGSSKINLELEFTKNRKIKITISENNFLVNINGNTMDVKNLLMIICKNWGFKNNNLRSIKYVGHNDEQTFKKIESIISKHIEEVKFCNNVNLASLFKKDERVIFVDPSNKTDKFISQLIDSFGFKNISLLLQKLDNKIQKIKFDTEYKSFDIFHKNNDISISSRNLSFGTKKILEILALSLPLFQNGGIFLIDEVENGLHLSLIQLLVSFFEDEDINTAQAQLFMTTHNPLLMERKIIEPFNVYIMEKSSFCNIKNVNFKNKRTYIFRQSLKPKNYFNDLFWLDNNLEDKSTLSNLTITKIVSEMSSEVKWVKK